MDPQTITEQLLFSTVRLEAEKAEGTEAGTAFIYGYQTDTKLFLFLVTNKHVVQGAKVGRFFFTLSDGSKPLIGRRFNVQMDQFETRWLGHELQQVDIAVMPLVPVLEAIQKQGQQVFFKSIPDSLIPSDEQAKELDPLEEIVFVGYPSGLFDSRNLLPIMRRGTTATPPYLDYEGLPAFLVDASVFPGSSGSPVLLVNRGAIPTRKGTIVGDRVHLLGIISSVYYRIEEGEVQLIPQPTAKSVSKTQQMIDLGVVFKSSAIRATVTRGLKQHGVL